MQPGPACADARLAGKGRFCEVYEAEAVGGMQNKATVCGREVSETQAPVAQSAFVVHSVKLSSSSMQYEPRGEGEPVREIVSSKQGRFSNSHSPAPFAAQSELLPQPRNEASLQLPILGVGVAHPASSLLQQTSSSNRPHIKSVQLLP